MMKTSLIYILLILLSVNLYPINEDDYSKVVVLPNPYNLSDNESLSKGLLFMNLPATTKKILIFKFDGGLVATLTEENGFILTSSSNILFGRWYGKNDDGNVLAAGVYFYYVTNADESKGHLGKICIVK